MGRKPLGLVYVEKLVCIFAEATVRCVGIWRDQKVSNSLSPWQDVVVVVEKKELFGQV